MYVIEYKTPISKYVVSSVIYDENNKINLINSFCFTDGYILCKYFKNKEECNAVVNFLQNYVINHCTDIDIDSIQIKEA